MKIFVLYNNKSKLNRDKVISDVSSYYKHSLDDERWRWGTKTSSILESIMNGIPLEVVWVDTNQKNLTEFDQAMRDQGCDLLISYDMAGFDYVTLTDNYALNMYVIPQIHFCTSEEMTAISKVTAINMFFACLERV